MTPTSWLLDSALSYANDACAELGFRALEASPFVRRSLGVYSFVMMAGADEEQEVAALLLDLVTDDEGRRRVEEIRLRCSDRVASILEGCLGPPHRPKPAWHPGQKAYIAGLRDAPPQALLVACAYELFNAIDLLRDVEKIGLSAFEQLDASRQDTVWYYGVVADAFAASELDGSLVERLAAAAARLKEVEATGAG